jgi:hypothetical protein
MAGLSLIAGHFFEVTQSVSVKTKYSRNMPSVELDGQEVYT